MTRLASSGDIANTPLCQFAREQCNRLLGRLAFRVGRAAKSPDSAQIHDLRVAIRRFSQVFRAFKPCFRGKEVRRIRQELKRIMAIAGEVRNQDVLLKLVSKANLDSDADLLMTTKNERHEAERSLISLLRSWLERKSSMKWRTALEAAVAQTDSDSSSVVIVQPAQKGLPRMAEEFFERGAEAARPKASPRQMHRFRIACKKFRYTLELYAPLYGPALNPRLEDLKRLQTVLGDINDCEAARDMLLASGRPAPLIAWLKRRQRRKMSAFREMWTATFEPARQRVWIDFLKRVPSLPRGEKKPARRADTTIRPGGKSRTAVA